MQSSGRITAKEAKLLAEQSESMKVTNWMMAFYERVRKESEVGKFSFSISSWSPLSHNEVVKVKQRLAELGYVVKESHGDQRDPYTSITVSWN